MTDYNDGKWHGWNGGECPVHQDSVVDVQYLGKSRFANDKASLALWEWSNLLKMVAFRVIKPYVEPKKPREFWIAFKAGYVIDVVYEKPNDMYGYIHVREVLE
jgi:hypothetical protein